MLLSSNTCYLSSLLIGSYKSFSLTIISGFFNLANPVNFQPIQVESINSLVNSEEIFLVASNPSYSLAEVTPEESPQGQNNDPMIGVQMEDWAYIGSFLLLVTVIILIGLISKRVEMALLFGLGLTVIFFLIYFLII